MARASASTLTVVTICVLVLAACGGIGATPSPSGPPPWNHDPDDGELGPGGWGAIDASYEACASGDAQSPIDVVGAMPADLPPLEFAYAPVALVVENTGHTVEVPMPEGGDAQTLTIGEDRYRLLQYHVHAPSEHTVEGEAHDLELHLVHRNDAGELAVVGVLFDVSAAPNPVLDLVISSAPDTAGEEADLGEEVTPLDLLPIAASSGDIPTYATYPGSLTTPGCTEGVRWIVVADTLGVSQATTDRLRELIAAFPGYHGHDGNNRPIQPLNDRVIETADE